MGELPQVAISTYIAPRLVGKGKFSLPYSFFFQLSVHVLESQCGSRYRCEDVEPFHLMSLLLQMVDRILRFDCTATIMSKLPKLEQVASGTGGTEHSHSTEMAMRQEVSVHVTSRETPKNRRMACADWRDDTTAAGARWAAGSRRYSAFCLA